MHLLLKANPWKVELYRKHQRQINNKLIYFISYSVADFFTQNLMHCFKCNALLINSMLTQQPVQHAKMESWCSNFISMSFTDTLDLA